MNIKWLHAQFNLAWRVVIHYVKKAMPWMPRYGYNRFRENYVSDGLPAFTKEHRQIAHMAGQCITCGQCDVACPKLTNRVEFLGPMKLVVSGFRAGPYLKDIRSTLEQMTSDSCEQCGQCEKACPVQIPILQLSHMASRQLKELDNFLHC